LPTADNCKYTRTNVALNQTPRKLATSVTYAMCECLMSKYVYILSDGEVHKRPLVCVCVRVYCVCH
jgi:hypothetical protein